MVVSPSLFVKSQIKMFVLTVLTMWVKLRHRWCFYQFSCWWNVFFVNWKYVNTFHPQYSPRSSRHQRAHRALRVHSSSLLAVHPCLQSSPLLASEWDTCGNTEVKAVSPLLWQQLVWALPWVCECVWFHIRWGPLSYFMICVLMCTHREHVV